MIPRSILLEMKLKKKSCLGNQNKMLYSITFPGKQFHLQDKVEKYDRARQCHRL
jgi:hypothetical protein